MTSANLESSRYYPILTAAFSPRISRSVVNVTRGPLHSMSPVWIYIALVMATDKVSDGGRVAFDGVLEEKDGEVLWKHLLKLDPSMSPEEFQTEGKWDLEELREEIRIILRDVDFLEGKEQIDLKLDPPSPEVDLVDNAFKLRNHPDNLNSQTFPNGARESSGKLRCALRLPHLMHML
eukprot:1372993-Amorphochlora_amoeboformis.AAC.1